MENTTRPGGGLFLDSSLQDQPKDTHRFALNAVDITELGDVRFLSNEESNAIAASLPNGYVPLGKIYMVKGKTAILSVSQDETTSEIGILDDQDNYTTHVNDADSLPKDKLGFKLDKQIQGIYRLRLGCKNVIYFVDGNKPKYFDFDSPEDFKLNDGTWSTKLFSLQREYSSIPAFEKVEVLDSGGQTLAGSYNIAVQYVDSSLNPTEFITTSPTIKIYNDLSNESFVDIRGSINTEIDYLKYPTTGKAIKVTLANLDTNFLYYRLAFIEATSGTGLVSRVRYTDVIPTSKNFFIYTGQNAASEGTEEEVRAFADIIGNAEHIAQLDDRLLLSNTEGTQINFCRLQKYASRIKVDCITKTVVLSDLKDPSNPKNPTHSMGGTGYMPGELYSTAIVFVFPGGVESPAYHIPGKNPDIDPKTVFAPGEKVYPMSNNNQGSSVYTNNDVNCGGGDYWGRDSEGIPLTGRNIRHHRFPLRSEIKLPLIVGSKESEQSIDYYNLLMTVEGDLIVPNDLDDPSQDFDIRVNYQVEGQDFFFTLSIRSMNYFTGSGTTYTDFEAVQVSQFHGNSVFTITSIEISDINGLFHTISENSGSATYNNDFGVYFDGPASITTKVDTFNSTIQGRHYTTEILGFKYSGIDVPSLEDTNGIPVIGYYIVRNERTEFDKTVLDSGVLVPSIVNKNYISHGLLAPENVTLSPDVYGLIHPEHKFNGKEYFVYDEMIQEGNFTIDEAKYGKINYDDVYDGSSLQDGQKDGNDDGGDDGKPANLNRAMDGWSFNLITRDNIANFESRNQFILDNDDIKERFYLSALESKSINDNANDVYNISADNKVGMIQLANGVTIPNGNNLPYVIMRRTNLDAYSNFRVLPYYKENTNIKMFNTTGHTTDSITVFNGDSYVSPMRYVNTMFWDNRVAKRKGKKSILKVIIGAVIAIVGVVLAAFTGGATLLVVGTGIAMIGGGALLVSSGIKMENANKAYIDEYDKGLRETTLDRWVDTFYNYRSTVGDYFPVPWGGQTKWSAHHAKDGPSDDTIQWISDCVTDLWFETSFNTNLRVGINADTPDFLNAPGRIESGNDSPIDLWEFFDIQYANSNAERYPISNLERHLSRKMLAFSDEREDNRVLIGVPLGEFYFINPDYNRFNAQKLFLHLPLEYDCCSECQEDFPHRWRFSEQSFQEELSDNYRIFLPNNYRDIPGETGEITNMFTIGNDLFFHTEEGIWQQPRDYQERITDQIVSFIGTGNYASIPPQKVLDGDTGNTAGLQHKWSAIRTPHGYFFLSENQKKFYQFTGKDLRSISSFGLYSWMKNNIEVNADKDYTRSTGDLYPYRDNPSNPLGTGFITAYDSVKERILLTKKDFKFGNDISEGSDFSVASCDGQLYKFENISETIGDREADGWLYEGIENCKMKFSKTEIITVLEEREVTVTVASDAIVIPFFDTTSMNNATINNISNTLDAWFPAFKASVNGGDNDITFINPGTWNRWGTENWLKDPANIVLTQVGLDKSVILLVFVDEVHSGFHGGAFTSPMTNPTALYESSLFDFTLISYPKFKSFTAINYPILRNVGTCKEYLQHAIGAIEGKKMTQAEVDGLNRNLYFSETEWTSLKNNLKNNPYAIIPTWPKLRDYGWLYKEDRRDGIDNNGTPDCPVDGVSVITPCQFTLDIENLLQSGTNTEVILVEVDKEVSKVEYVSGTLLDDPIQSNSSWTLSYGLKTDIRPQEHWISWHSYLPSFYINTADKLYSYINGNDNIWKHGVKGQYQTFYGKFYPHIIEYVSVSNPIVTRVWEFLRLVTEAKRFNSNLNEFVDVRLATFNKMVLYNSRQCSGLLNIVVKDLDLMDANYLENQVINNDDVIIDRNERDWTINDFRDIRINYDEPIWNSNTNSFQNEYFIDKVLNVSSMDVNKDWTQLESFRDKYLVVRLIFDKFADVKLLTNYSVEDENQSFR